MHCIEQGSTRRPLAARVLRVAAALVLSGCSTPMSPMRPLPPAAPVAPLPPVPQTGTNARPAAPDSFAAPSRPVPPPPANMAALSQPARLPAPGPVRNWNEVRLQAAKRLVDAHPETSYLGPVPDILLAIPVLVIELNGDGSVRRVDVLRVPTQATDTVQLAIAAVKRAAPYGDVSRLPKPWQFVETFLFNDDRKFKPRTLDR
ncbi:MAG: hypothetical protein H7143_14055 [Pseudorhodobacter sp.]|nr:hypothetical protein [Rhizobacter sp.]